MLMNTFIYLLFVFFLVLLDENARSYPEKHCFTGQDRLLISGPIRRNTVSPDRTFSKNPKLLL